MISLLSEIKLSPRFHDCETATDLVTSIANYNLELMQTDCVSHAHFCADQIKQMLGNCVKCWKNEWRK